eukprot:353222-Chlamydomonas_euryale.AAC.4
MHAMRRMHLHASKAAVAAAVLTARQDGRRQRGGRKRGGQADREERRQRVDAQREASLLAHGHQEKIGSQDACKRPECVHGRHHLGSSGMDREKLRARLHALGRREQADKRPSHMPWRGWPERDSMQL